MHRRLFLKLLALIPFARLLDTEGALAQPVDAIDLPAGFGAGLSFPGYFTACSSTKKQPAPSGVTIREFKSIKFFEKLLGVVK